MSRYVFGRGVESDVDSIWNYIAEDSLDVADRWVSKLLDAIELLANDPGAGHTRSDLTRKSILFWPVGSYLILYPVRPNLIKIVGVTHGARDRPTFLKRPSE